MPPPDPTSKEAENDAKPQASTAALIMRLIRLTWNYRAGVIRIVILQMCLLALALSGLGLIGLGLDVIGQAIGDNAKAPRWPLGLDPPADWSAMTQVLVISGLVFAIAALRFALDRASWICKALLVRDVLVDLRKQVYDKMQRLSFRFFDANQSGSIINRVTGDVQAVRRFIDGVMIEVLMLVISLVFFLGYMLSIHVKLTLACLATTPVLWVLTATFSRIVRPAYRKNRELFDKAVLVLSENAQGVHVVKGFAMQARERQKFKEANDAVADQHRWIFSRVALFVPSVGVITSVNLLVLLIYGGHLYIHDDNFAFGSGLFVFAGLLQQFSSQVGNIAQIANAVQRSMTGAQRVFEVLDEPIDIQSPPPEEAITLERAKGDIKFENVSFAYQAAGDEKSGTGFQPVIEPDHRLEACATEKAEVRQTHAINGITLDIKPGEVIAILGATGSGKSTLMSMIPRFYDPATGRILIDGQDIRGYDLDTLRRNVGIVFQETFLFSNTVKFNIAFGHPDATQQQIEQAATIASAHDFVMRELDEGYDTVLTEGGNGLSGGQRQRLAIARALLMDPPILLMDDPTAAIDPETEHEIMHAMNQAMAERTTLIVAHRFSTLKRADRVVVMEAGRITAVGTHDELMQSSDHYRKAAQVQMADEESRRLLGIEEVGE